MKKSAKAALSVLLSLTFVFLLFVPSFARLAEGYTAQLPTVYLQGQGTWLCEDQDNININTRIDEIKIPDGYIAETGKELIKPLMRGLVLNDWDEWEDIVVDRVSALFEKLKLDENGENSNGSGIRASSFDSNKVNPDGTYDLRAYHIDYDWRLDPCYIADIVHRRVVKIKELTNCEKVNLVGRSIGASVVLAYLNKYGAEDFASIIIYCGSFYGMEALSRIFAGKFDVDAKAMSRFIDYYAENGDLGDGNDQLISVLKDLVAVMAATHGLDLPAGAIEKIYEKVYTDVYPRLLVNMYGSMPSFWSLVGDDDYEDAKKLIFGGQEDVYAGMIEKIDHFHYDILVPATDMIKRLVSEGNKIYIVAKYGVPMIPANDLKDVQSDMLTSVYSSSPNATCSKITETLSKEYLEEAAAKGTDRYISPDKQIDASTALLPDRTWFIKNVEHRSMPDCISSLFSTILDYNGYMTVFSSEDAPQYLLYDKETDLLYPLAEDNMNTNAEWNTSFLKRLIRLIRTLFELLKAYITK